MRGLPRFLRCLVLKQPDGTQPTLGTPKAIGQRDGRQNEGNEGNGKAKPQVDGPENVLPAHEERAGGVGRANLPLFEVVPHVDRCVEEVAVEDGVCTRIRTEG